MKSGIKFVLFAFFMLLTSCKEDKSVRGWTILSDNMENAALTIKSAKKYDINHLQLSHHIVHDLREVKQESVRKKVCELTRLAHEEGIKEVLVWDHSFYALDYYPDRFKTGPGGTLNLDNPHFWEWYKQDYREMLDLIPDIDGLILTFIETGAHAEKQYSENMKTNQEKLAAVVNAVADIVVDEYRKKLYIRTFAYTKEEYENIIGCVDHIKSKEVILMMKETPHDFFLTHPNDVFVGKIDRPTIVEFDTGNEFSGQGVIANTWPDYVMKRWKDFMKRPHVVGYVARTDRYGTTRSIGTPNEVLLYALKRTTEYPEITEELVYDEFICERYGEKALLPVKNAFSKAYDIVSSSLYTLGTNVANHSAMAYEPYSSSYGRHVSGRWIDPPVVFVEHGVNQEFHYWKDIINHIAPTRFKTTDFLKKTEIKQIIDQQWLEPVELMDTVFLNYILTEKQYGVNLAMEALSEIEQAKNVLDPLDYEELYQLFKRTYLTAQLYEAVSSAYYRYRIYAKDEFYQSEKQRNKIILDLRKIDEITDEMKTMEGTFPIGEWNWLKDADTALSYKEKILSGWSEYNNVRLLE